MGECKPRLIDANTLLRDMGIADATKYGNKTTEQRDRSYETRMAYEIVDEINGAPTVEAEPVRHAHWIISPNRYTMMRYSALVLLVIMEIVMHALSPCRIAGIAVQKWTRKYEYSKLCVLKK